jgi:hypothetical protein
MISVSRNQAASWPVAERVHEYFRLSVLGHTLILLHIH